MHRKNFTPERPGQIPGRPAAAAAISRLPLLCGALLLAFGASWGVTSAFSADTPPLPADLGGSPPSYPSVAPGAMWNDLGNETAAAQLGPSSRARLPLAYRLAELDLDSMKSRLAQAPPEETTRARDGLEITLPMPDGTYQRFRVVESPILGPQVQAIVPDFRSYLAQGVDDPTAVLRFDTSQFGFRAYGRTAQGTLWIDPYELGDTRNYVSAWRHDFEVPSDAFDCGTLAEEPWAGEQGRAIPGSGSTLSTYRLAVTLTGEYTVFFGGGPGAVAAAGTTINRANVVFENDTAIRFLYTYALFYLDPATDPFPNGPIIDDGALDINQTVTDAQWGASNYDIGHLLSQGSTGGYAPGQVCTSSKARAGTAGTLPLGDPFDIDYVTHEIGHQMGAYHTFNGTTGQCGGQRTAITAYEPGSGSTIMAYAGICGAENIQPNSDPYFHVRSLEQIISTRIASGCKVETANGNTPPVADAGLDRTIPRGTPFWVLGGGTDADGDALTYTWEQYDLGAPSPPTDPLGPLFRSFDPGQSFRYFPDLAQVLSGSTDPWEITPTVDRSLTLRLTVRDNSAGGGGVDDDELELTVLGAPFQVTYPNGGESFTAGQPVTVTWNKGGSVAANVVIFLYHSGSFATLKSSTPNDGSEQVILPCGITDSASRIWIEEITGQSLGVHVFDVSNGNFTLTDGLADYAPWQPGGWGDKVVVNSVDSQNLPTELFGDQNSFLSWAYLNFGNAWGCGPLEFEARIDERAIQERSFPVGHGPNSGNTWFGFQSYVSGGRHTAWLLMDPNDALSESNESNNGYARQWVWEPQVLPAESAVRRPEPPDRVAGHDHIPSGTPTYLNVDGMRILDPLSYWRASAIGSLNGSDYDIRFFSPSTGVENGFDVPLVSSRLGGGLTDVVLSNDSVTGGGSLDIGLERFGGSGDFIADTRITGFRDLVVGGQYTGVPMAQDQLIDLESVIVTSEDAGRLLLEVDNVSASQTVKLLLFNPSPGFTNRSGRFAEATVDANGRASIDFTATAGEWAYLLVREANEGTAPFTYDVRLRPTPPDLATAVLPGSHGPVVPRPDNTINSGDPVPAPTLLPGDSFSTTVYYHLRNEGPADADSWDFAVPVDGDPGVGGGPFAGPFPLPGGTSDIFSQVIGGAFYITGGRHTLGIFHDASDSYDELDEGNNRHAEQWIWEPTQLAIGETVGRGAPPDPTGGWEDIPIELPRELNVDGLRTPAYAPNGGNGFWGAFAATPVDGDIALRIHPASTGAQDGFESELEMIDVGLDFTELVLFDLDLALPSGVAYDAGIVANEPGSNYVAHATESLFLGDGEQTPIGLSFPGLTLAPNEIVAVYEFATFDGTGDPVPVAITVENQSGNADLVLAIFGRTDGSGFYTAFESWEGGLVDDTRDGGDETAEVVLDPDQYYGVAVFKQSGGQLAKDVEFTLHFTDPTTTSVDPIADLEAGIRSYPEPFAAQTEVQFSLAEAGRASIRIFDVKGRLVRTLVEGNLEAGRHALTWKGRDDEGRSLPNGVYLARFQHPGGEEMRRMVLVR